MTIHTALSVEIAKQLAPLLSDRYSAVLNDWFTVAMPEAVVTVGAATGYPDAYVAEARPGTGAAGASTGVAVAPPPLLLVTAMPEPVRHVTVEIRDTSSRRIVTAIEVLSPTNKRADGRREYLRKRRRLLLSSAHLIEIDLLRRGRRVPMRDALPEAPYFVLVSRAEKRPLTEVWPVRLDQILPTVPVPLLDKDPDVPLDLQKALTTLYDGLYFEKNLDYTRPPLVPLGPEDAAWAEERLRAWRASRRQS